MKVKYLKYLTLQVLIITTSFFSRAQEVNELLIKDRVDFYGSLAREPMIVEHPDGAIFVAGYKNASTEPQLWKSHDQGKTWAEVNVGTKVEGAHGNSDVDLAIDSDGVIYFLTMKFTKLPDDMTDFDFSSMKGEHIAIGVSTDKGESWKWNYLSRNEYDDRPWIAISPDNTAHVIWNDGKGVHHVLSEDKGKTWQPRPLIYPKGGSSHFAIGPKGQLAVRVVPLSASGNQFDQEVDLIRLSVDKGKTWSDLQPPGQRDWNEDMQKGVPRWVEPLAWDKGNNLYYLWSEGKQLKLGKLMDSNKNWQTWTVAKDDEVVYYPYMSVNDNTIAFTWISGLRERLRHNAGLVNINKDTLDFYILKPLELDIWTRFEGFENQLSTGGEYFPIVQLSDGDFRMVTPIQNPVEQRFGFTWWRLSKK